VDLYWLTSGNFTSVPDLSRSSGDFVLEPNHPNPFNPQTTIRYHLNSSAKVDLRVYDSAGRLVQVLVDGVELMAGRHTAVWGGRDDMGRSVASGTYHYRLELNGQAKTGTMSLVR
jgi:hypothetical protein